MKRRRGSRHDYLIVSDRSSFVFPASEMVTQWDGLLVHRSEVEERNPQEFVRARRDPEALSDVRVRVSATPYCGIRYVARGYGIVDIGRDFPGVYEAIATASGDQGVEVSCNLQVAPNTISEDITSFYAIGASAGDPYGLVIVTAGTATPATAAFPNPFQVT